MRDAVPAEGQDKGGGPPGDATGEGAAAGRPALPRPTLQAATGKHSLRCSVIHACIQSKSVIEYQSVFFQAQAGTDAGFAQSSVHVSVHVFNLLLSTRVSALWLWQVLILPGSRSVILLSWLPSYAELSLTVYAQPPAVG